MKPILLVLIPILLIEAIIRVICLIFDLARYLITMPFILVRNGLAKLLFSNQVKKEIKMHNLGIEEVLNNPKYKPVGRYDK